MRTRLLVTVLIAALVLAGFAPAVSKVAAQDKLPARAKCNEDLKGQTITFHAIGDNSGPYAPITQPLIAGFTDAIKYYNGQGGICGAEIKLTAEDTAGKQEQTQSFYQRARALTPKPLMIMMYNSADAELLRKQVEEDKIPILLTAGSTKGLYGEKADQPGWIFASIPLYTDQMGAFCRWVGKAWTTDLKKTDKPKIGHLSWEGAFGRSTETPETTAYCKAQGVDVVGSEYFLPTATDVTAQINNLVNKGANILFTTTLASGSALIAADVVNLGLEDKVTLAGVNWVLDTSTGLLGQRKLKKSGMPSTDGFLGVIPYMWWDEKHPGTAFVQEQFTANKRAATMRGISYLAGFGIIDTYIELVTQTVNRVGSKKLDGTAMKETMDTFKYESLGGVFSYAFDKNVRAQNVARVAKMSYLMGADGKPVVVEVGGQKLLVTTIVPLSQKNEVVPDLKPGGKDVVK